MATRKPPSTNPSSRINASTVPGLTVTPTVPSGRRAEGEALIADIRKRRKRIAEDFYEIAADLRRLS